MLDGCANSGLAIIVLILIVGALISFAAILLFSAFVAVGAVL